MFIVCNMCLNTLPRSPELEWLGSQHSAPILPSRIQQAVEKIRTYHHEPAWYVKLGLYTDSICALFERGSSVTRHAAMLCVPSQPETARMTRQLNRLIASCVPHPKFDGSTTMELPPKLIFAFSLFCDMLPMPRTRRRPMPRRVHCRPEPGRRGRGQALVHINTGATAVVVGFLQSVQKGPGVTRACVRSIPPQLVVASGIPHPAEHSKLEGSHV